MNQLNVLLLTALSIAFFHTVFGPDHYLPFVAMGKARDWKIGKLLFITVLCGFGHVLSSVVLGYAGIGLGTALIRLELIESVRGDIAGYMLLIFGFVYFIYGLFAAGKGHTHTHLTGADHEHRHDKQVHVHSHDGGELHMHTHSLTGKNKTKSITPWVLFTIFLFGPCEPLIPLLMYPAATLNGWSVFMVTLVFGITTITTMTTIVVALYYGLKKIKISSNLSRYAHALSGFTILLCGLAVTLGL
jgi:nickel/cobalt exporter